MPIPKRALRAVAQKNQRNDRPVCNGAPFNVTNPSNDVEIEKVGLNGLKPMVSKKASPQRKAPDAAVAMKHVPVVVPVARFTSKIMAGVNKATKIFKNSLCAGSGTKSLRLGSSSSALGANAPRGRGDDDILGRHKRGSLLPLSAAAAGGIPATPVVGTPSIGKMTTFDRGRSLPRFSFVDEIESKNKILTGHVNGSKRFGSFSRCTERWTMVLSLLWLCTFIVNVDSYDPLPNGHGCCDDGNIFN
jgi:hypothetical protein